MNNILARSPEFGPSFLTVNKIAPSPQLHTISLPASK